MELTCHDGTVRDVIFMPDTAQKSSLLVSAGAGDCKICVTDCASGTLLRAMPGHSGLLYNCLSLFLTLQLVFVWSGGKCFWISICTNLFQPELNHTRQGIFAFARFLFSNLYKAKCCPHTLTIRYVKRTLYNTPCKVHKC